MISFEQLVDTANSMRIGHQIRLARQDMILASPNYPRRFGTLKDYFLSQCIGSAYGSVRWHEDIISGDVTISKHTTEHREDGALFHVDFDRQDLFTCGPDGLWRRR